jgi:hypothetical protein
MAESKNLYPGASFQENLLSRTQDKTGATNTRRVRRPGFLVKG